MTLRCGVNIKGRRSPANFVINPGTEILWGYGDIVTLITMTDAQKSNLHLKIYQRPC